MTYRQFCNIITHSCNYHKGFELILKHYFNNSQNNNNISKSHQFLKHYFKDKVTKTRLDKKKTAGSKSDGLLSIEQVITKYFRNY